MLYDTKYNSEIWDLTNTPYNKGFVFLLWS